MVGYRNYRTRWRSMCRERIRLSDGGVSEPVGHCRSTAHGAYQAFRWWGIGTADGHYQFPGESVSGFPMVGYRNRTRSRGMRRPERIRLSDGGVSERQNAHDGEAQGAYQAFRWWGIGTSSSGSSARKSSVSGFPMVGYRNSICANCTAALERIRLSDGGVSERYIERFHQTHRAYQAFRWWGIGTVRLNRPHAGGQFNRSGSSDPRNREVALRYRGGCVKRR